jgi:hypothetical protein
MEHMRSKEEPRMEGEDQEATPTTETLRREATIKRLRISKLETEKEDRRRGIADGQAWADRCAEYAWLRHLSEGPDPEHLVQPFELLRSAVDPNDEMDPAELQETCFGEEKRLSKEYICSFIDGAAGRYHELSSEI